METPGITATPSARTRNPLAPKISPLLPGSEFGGVGDTMGFGQPEVTRAKATLTVTSPTKQTRSAIPSADFIFPPL